MHYVEYLVLIVHMHYKRALLDRILKYLHLGSPKPKEYWNIFPAHCVRVCVCVYVRVCVRLN